jgi:hypothetical protein
VFGFIDVNFADYFEFSPRFFSGHIDTIKLKLQTRGPEVHRDYRRCFFTNSVVPIFNALPDVVINAGSLKAFRTKLDTVDQQIYQRFLRRPY